MYFNVMRPISKEIYYMFTIYIKLKFWLFIFWCLEGDVLSKLHQSKINSFYSKTKTLRRYILKLSLNSQFFGINFESDFDLKVQSTPSIPLQILLSVHIKHKFPLQPAHITCIETSCDSIILNKLSIDTNAPLVNKSMTNVRK